MGLRAMFSAISGLQSHSTWLDVIGNNISNVNTTAYKASRVTFSDAISQTTSAGSGASSSSNLGGVNPTQVGLGSRVSSIQTLFNPGPILQTGNATDIAIKGDGFLVVRQGNSTLYSRAGNLTFDGAGNLVDANGGLIQGFQAQLEYVRTDFNSESSLLLPAPALQAGVPAQITRAEFVLDTSNTTNIGNIQIQKGMTLPPRATSMLDFRGNMDSFLQVTDAARGGVFTFGQVAGNQYMPFASAIEQGVAIYEATKVVSDAAEFAAGRYSMHQVSDFAGQVQVNPYLGFDTPIPVIVRGIDRNTGNFVWETGQNPAHTMTQTVYDSLGNPREITINLYQVNDIGDVYNSTAGVSGNNPSGPSQVAYAWYAFETTGGQVPTTNNLLGGTAIIEGDYGIGWPGEMGYDRGLGDAGSGVRAQFCGDLLYFNTDGSLASQGAVWITGTGGQANSIQATAHLYMPPLNYFDPVAAAGFAPVSPLPTIGAEVMDITLDFGRAGGLGDGQRNGIYCDAAGSYQVIDGVNTYIPNHSAFVEKQDGYSEGQLAAISFDATGILKGKFTTSAGDQIIDLAQLVMARVSNPEGLNKTGNSYYSSSNNSGSIYVGTAGENGLGLVEGYSLEGSNVDLTAELTNMIIAQRGFEVNARTISTTNETLNTLVNLGR